MLVTINKNGGLKSSGGNSAQAYLLGKKNAPRKNARILKGDPDATTEVINGLNFAKIYTSGTLAFAYGEGDKLTEQDKFDIIEKFENSLFPNIPIEQISGYWVEHTDKVLRDDETDELILDANGREQKRLELNFIYANVELITGKALPIYYHKNDVNLMSAYRDVINAEYDLIDPNAINQRQLLSIPKNIPKHKKEILENAHDLVCGELLIGNINDRSDILKVLTGAGIEIASKSTNKYISLKDPEGGQNIRMKGELYEQEFTIEKFNREHQSSEATEFGYSAAYIAEARERLQECIGKRAKRFESRFFSVKPTPYSVIRKSEPRDIAKVVEFDDNVRVDYNKIAEFSRAKDCRGDDSIQPSTDADYGNAGLSLASSEPRERSDNINISDKPREPSPSDYSAVWRKPKISQEYKDLRKSAKFGTRLSNTVGDIRIGSRFHAHTEPRTVENVYRYFSDINYFSYDNIWSMGVDSTCQGEGGRIGANSRADNKTEFERDRAGTQARAEKANDSNAKRFSRTEKSIRDTTRSIRKFIAATRSAVEPLHVYNSRREKDASDRRKANENRERFEREHKWSEGFAEEIGRFERCITITGAINSQVDVVVQKHLQAKQEQQNIEHQIKLQEQDKLQLQQKLKFDSSPQPKLESKTEVISPPRSRIFRP